MDARPSFENPHMPTAYGTRQSRGQQSNSQNHRSPDRIPARPLAAAPFGKESEPVPQPPSMEKEAHFAREPWPKKEAPEEIPGLRRIALCLFTTDRRHHL